MTVVSSGSELLEGVEFWRGGCARSCVRNRAGCRRRDYQGHSCEVWPRRIDTASLQVMVLVPVQFTLTWGDRNKFTQPARYPTSGH